ncbi:PREDICTED: leukotriene A-4 hydrolase isoform X1 [Drosophila arizonae]|uniref:Leukotriene A(4) hydrolase n=2 Tax=Drosophila arizonae TaxID=7263 RepID=A0ABM1NYJ8_DROAR|nr:PREDICTED: leukotriene A-4 hydrolase isoform X1 [Drosophila arizonae]
MSIAKRVQQWATFARTWHIYDCTWQNPFESAQLVKTHLMGLHKPIYHPMITTRTLCTTHLQKESQHSQLLPIYQVRKRNMGRLSSVDPSSYSEPEKITTEHTAIHWNVDFEATKLRGSVLHKFKVLTSNLESILLDVRDIEVKNATLLAGGSEQPINYFISDPVPDVGQKLTLELPAGTAKGSLNVRIDYETANNASGLQWLNPNQTLGKQHPYMFSQCQAIHARSVMPCQDTPAVKFTYDAVVEHPKELTALMSALIDKNEPGKTYFKQEVPIPAYLVAIAIGKLVSRRLGENSNVWAEEAIVDACAEEFSETSTMLKTASDLCGPYVWKQYDLLVMPPSFPFGGMENPCLTFVTPTLLAGDKSLANVVAHEIAHSWTGNLVTNKNFEHFWLNEGFTVFVESKIVGRMQGAKELDFRMLSNLTELQECLRTQLAGTPELTRLVVDLSNCGPDDAFSSVPYIKGSTFLRYLEDLLGGPTVFEPFLRDYLKKFAYKSIVTDDFKGALYDYFKDTDKKDKLGLVDWELWLKCEGMPPIIPKFDESLANVTKNLASQWSTKTVDELANSTDINQPISIHQLIEFLGKLIECKDIVELNERKIELLENTYNLKKSKNAEVRFRLNRLIIRARLIQRLDEIIEFANSNFRMKFCRPIYRDLAAWPEAKPRAVDNFLNVKDQMMAVCSHTIEKDLGLK